MYDLSINGQNILGGRNVLLVVYSMVKKDEIFLSFGWKFQILFSFSTHLCNRNLKQRIIN